MPVSSVAREEVVTEPPEASLVDAVRTMQEKAVGSVVVVDDGTPIGIVAARELAVAVLDEGIDAESTPIGNLVGDDPVTIESDAGIYDLVELLSDHGVRRVPVVEEGELVGIVSISDIVVLLGMELQHVANAIRAASPPYEQLATERYE